MSAIKDQIAKLLLENDTQNVVEAVKLRNGLLNKFDTDVLYLMAQMMVTYLESAATDPAVFHRDMAIIRGEKTLPN